METNMEQEIEMVRGMLEGDAVETRAGREKLLHELARIRMRQEERLQGALTAKKNLQQVRQIIIVIFSLLCTAIKIFPSICCLLYDGQH